MNEWKEAQGRWEQYVMSIWVSLCSFVHSTVTHMLPHPDWNQRLGLAQLYQ